MVAALKRQRVGSHPVNGKRDQSMAKLLSNGDGLTSVRRAFEQLASKSKRLQLAAPYFTYSDILLDALKGGSSLELLIGLNAATHPDALAAVMQHRRVTVRYYTGRFHAKLYVFDEAALVGSANLTSAGFEGNREIVAWFSESDDESEVDQARVIFETLWETARTLSSGTLVEFRQAWLAARGAGPDPDKAIAQAVGEHQPPTISAASQTKKKAQVAAERLRRQILQEYVPAFREVGAILGSDGLYRHDVMEIEAPFRVNRFLNWLRLTHVPEDTWRDAPQRDEAGRLAAIRGYGKEWKAAKDGLVDEGYAEGIRGVLAPFADPPTLSSATKDQIMDGLLGIHAFTEQLRFIEGGRAALPGRFWAGNNDDVDRVRRTLGYLLHGTGDFIDRLERVVHDPKFYLWRFGKFCCLELYGTVKSEESPPVNGRSAKALRFLGFKVSGD